MKTRTLTGMLIFAALLALSKPALTEEPAASQNPLDQMAWIVGGKWEANGEKGPDGKAFHVEMSCRWGENHRALQFTTWFAKDGKLVPVYNGEYAWHPAKRKIIFVYTDDEGSLTEGEAVMNGDRLEQDFQIVGVDGVSRPFHSTILRRGANDYDWDVQGLKGGAWTKMFGLQYHRNQN